MRAIKMLGTALLFVALFTLLPGNSSGQSAPQVGVAKRFVGTWRLISITGGTPETPNYRGAHPTGLIYYDSLGNMAVQIMPDRPRGKYASTNPTADEALAAILGFTAYFGTYTVDEKARTVTHHRKGNINPGAIDDAVRHYEFVAGDRLVLTTPDNPPSHLTWERMK